MRLGDWFEGWCERHLPEPGSWKYWAAFVVLQAVYLPWLWWATQSN